jgi:tetratricopeptide (TPR) repeat protein
MNRNHGNVVPALLAIALILATTATTHAQVKAWEGTISIPTYPWQEDINPKFWALEGGASLSTTVKGAITYPYTMQDHLSRTKADRLYKALFLENEYLKITCLPELGGRLHSVLDKTRNEQMFHLNNVIKPSMIAMRGAFISGGVEWNAGPQVHTVTIVSPVDAVIGRSSDGSAFIEVNNVEKIFRTRWTARVTLHPGRAYLDEQIRLYNPTDGMHPYYFWNCTAQPNLPGTRFIYPMSLGTDHHGREFFRWPIHEGRDLSWLKNYDTWASIFAVGCAYDFFGAYHVDLDRGVVQVANHRLLPGKKAWTWGNWEFGLVSQENLTDDDGPYIEVQSGPLPTQSDYGMLAPRQEVAWQEWWYPVHGLGDGFEYATRDLAVQTERKDRDLHVRLIATGRFPQTTCRMTCQGRPTVERRIDLSPDEVQHVVYKHVGQDPVDITLVARQEKPLASFTTPLPIPKTEPPDPETFKELPDEQLTIEQTYLKGRRNDRSTSRLQARRYYEMALSEDAGHTPSLRALAVLDLEAGLYEDAVTRLERLLQRDADDGLAWYFLGVCHARRDRWGKTLECGYHAARLHGTRSLGYDLVGRALMRQGDAQAAVRAFANAMRSDPRDTRSRDHWLLAHYATGDREAVFERAKQAVRKRPTDLVPRALVGLRDTATLRGFAQEAKSLLGEDDFETLEAALVFAELGLYAEAARVLRAVCVERISPDQRSPLPLYYLAWFAERQGQSGAARGLLQQAAAAKHDLVFPSRPEAVDVLEFALRENPNDAHAHLHLGNLLAGLGRLDEAVRHWADATQGDPALSIAFRNLGLAAAARDNDLTKAADYYRQAIAARPSDQTLYRDLAEILVADGRRGQAIELLENMPVEGQRRSEITIQLAQAYMGEQRYSDAIDLLASTPYFVNWEGQDITWRLHYRAHVMRGQKRLDAGQEQAALEDFETALTYPENLGVGRSNNPQHAAAEFWRGETLAALGRPDEARAAWRQGAAGGAGSDEQNQYRQRCQEALDAAP